METARIIDLAPSTRGLTKAHLLNYINGLDSTPKTASIYGRALNQFYSFIGDNAEPDKSDFKAWKAHLMETCKPATTQLYITAGKLFFRWLYDEGLYQDITKSTKGVKMTKEHSKDHLTPEQVQDILKHTENTRDKAMLMLMITAGLRCIEVTRANIEDIRNVGGNTVLFLQGKGKLERDQYVKIAPQTHKAILAYLETRASTGDKEPLFCSEANRNSGQRLTTISVSRIVKTAFRRAGYNSDRLTAHSCRHTTATLNLMAGGTLQETQQLLRHQNLTTTTIYAHNLDRLNNNSERRVEDAIFGPGKEQAGADND